MTDKGSIQLRNGFIIHQKGGHSIAAIKADHVSKIIYTARSPGFGTPTPAESKNGKVHIFVQNESVHIFDCKREKFDEMFEPIINLCRGNGITASFELD